MWSERSQRADTPPSDSAKIATLSDSAKISTRECEKWQGFPSRRDRRRHGHERSQRADATLSDSAKIATRECDAARPSTTRSERSQRADATPSDSAMLATAPTRPAA